MPQKLKELTVEKRTEVITLSREGYSIREIALKTRISKSSVGYTIKKFSSTGSVKSAKRSRRPKKTTIAEDCFIQTTSKRNRQKSAQEITAEVNEHCDLPISMTTVRRRFHKVGFRGCIAIKKTITKTSK